MRLTWTDRYDVEDHGACMVIYPLQDREGNPLELEDQDHQSVCVQGDEATSLRIILNKATYARQINETLECYF